MERIKLTDISDYINSKNIINESNGIKTYIYQDNKVLKIYDEDSITRITSDGLLKLDTLSLEVFLKPIDMIVDGLKIVGYTEKSLDRKENYPLLIDDDKLLTDISTLSLNGFRIDTNSIECIKTENCTYFSATSGLNYSNADRTLLKLKLTRDNLTSMTKYFEDTGITVDINKETPKEKTL